METETLDEYENPEEIVAAYFESLEEFPDN